MHYLAICCLHPYPTPMGPMKFEVTHADTPYMFKIVSNLRIDPENLQSRGILLKIAIFGHFPCVQKFDYENVHFSDDMCIFILYRK